MFSIKTLSRDIPAVIKNNTGLQYYHGYLGTRHGSLPHLFSLKYLGEFPIGQNFDWAPQKALCLFLYLSEDFQLRKQLNKLEFHKLTDRLTDT